MPAARYWRVVGLQSIAGGPLELSALHLYLEGNRVDAAATLTCTIPPSAGAVANLQDDDTTTTCRWLDVSAPGFALVWDFGTAQDVRALRLGAGALESEFLQALALQHSSDGAAWTTLTSIPAFAWPGAEVMQPVPGDPHWVEVVSLLHFEGNFTNEAGATWTTVGSGNNFSAAKFGQGLSRTEGGNYIETQLELGPTWTIEFFHAPRALPQEGYNLAILQYGTAKEASDGFYYELWRSNLIGRIGWTYGGASNESVSGELHRLDHIALVCRDYTLKVFRNGQLSNPGVLVPVNNLTGNKPLRFGWTTHSWVQGTSSLLDELRITKGVARYTANFTPPVEPFSSIGGTSQVALRPRISPTVITLSGGTAQDAKVVVPLLEGAFDMQDGGWGKIVGTVKEKSAGADQPLRRKVILLNYRDHRMIRETWSDAVTGKYEFLRIDPNRAYTVITYDYNLNYRAVIADNLMPELM